MSETKVRWLDSLCGGMGGCIGAIITNLCGLHNYLIKIPIWCLCGFLSGLLCRYLITKFGIDLAVSIIIGLAISTLMVSFFFVNDMLNVWFWLVSLLTGTLPFIIWWGTRKRSRGNLEG